MVKNPYKMLLFTITKFTLRGTLFLPHREEAWFRPVWEEGRCGGIVGGTCRVAHRFHWELGRQQVNIYELSPAEDFLSPISRCWIYLHIFFSWIFISRQHLDSSTADLCEPNAGVNNICEVEEKECIVSLWN